MEKLLGHCKYSLFLIEANSGFIANENNFQLFDKQVETVFLSWRLGKSFIFLIERRFFISSLRRNKKLELLIKLLSKE